MGSGVVQRPVVVSLKRVPCLRKPVPRSIRPEEQYLAYLSLKFLLPKLVEAKRLTIERYENTLAAVAKAPTAPAEVNEVLQRHLGENRQDLGVLEKVAAAVIAGK